jgi:hypothetical protein
MLDWMFALHPLAAVHSPAKVLPHRDGGRVTASERIREARDQRELLDQRDAAILAQRIQEIDRIREPRSTGRVVYACFAS